ncbi:hypothetical protein IE53DRAFT_388053 [Violaceomyces palustris]|uniref:Uncharacterized protein n=1 Tax=Violaceomyces palustris TaxID=1673888 RepID=A0ACD0NV91_9BASI|nr:hypothetical protein IE53DRAFT_388053 [Violaceomyces palustris]
MLVPRSPNPARQALRAASQQVRSRCLRSSRPLISSRSYATGAEHAKAASQSSDVPWAVTSTVVFGSLFVYLTAPPSKKGDSHGHGHGHSEPKSEELEEEVEESSQEDTEAQVGEDEEKQEAEPEPKELPDGSIEQPDGFVEVKHTELHEDAPTGDKSQEDEGIAAAKDGNPVSHA